MSDCTSVQREENFVEKTLLDDRLDGRVYLENILKLSKYLSVRLTHRDPQAIKYLNFYDYAFLVLACKKFLTAHKFIYLPMILTAVCEKHKERVNICGKKVRPEIMRSKKYTELFQMKYRDFSSLVDAPFLSAIGTTYSSEFRNELGEDLFDGSVKVPKIAEEMIDLAYLV